MARKIIVLEDRAAQIQDLSIDLRDGSGADDDRVLNVFVKQTKGRDWHLTAIVERTTS
jgi:hypothetical protein